MTSDRLRRRPSRLELLLDAIALGLGGFWLGVHTDPPDWLMGLVFLFTVAYVTWHIYRYLRWGDRTDRVFVATIVILSVVVVVLA